MIFLRDLKFAFSANFGFEIAVNVILILCYFLPSLLSENR